MRECTSQVMTMIDWMEVLYFTGYNFYTHFTLSALGDNTHPNVYGSNYYPDLLHFLWVLSTSHEQHRFSSSQLLCYISLSSWNHTQVLEGSAQVLAQKKTYRFCDKRRNLSEIGEVLIHDASSSQAGCVVFSTPLFSTMNSSSESQ